MDKNFNSLVKVDEFTNVADIYYTVKSGGVSEGPYAGFNLALHVGDKEESVIKNRVLLEEALGKKIVFMHQSHSNRVEVVDSQLATSPKAVLEGKEPLSLGIEADGIVTTDRNVALAVLTADCLPLLMVSEDGKAAAAVHCGWKGMLAGIIKNATSLMRRYSYAPIHAYVGPCIGPEHYEVGPEILAQFSKVVENAHEEFLPADDGKYMCSLPGLCHRMLTMAGVPYIMFSARDTYGEDEKFFSYRRANVTGRMASIISLK